MRTTTQMLTVFLMITVGQAFGSTDSVGDATGFRYRVSTVLPAGLNAHTVKFTAYSGSGQVVAVDKFIAQLATKMANPVFQIFRDEDAYKQVRDAEWLTVTVDEKVIEKISVADLQLRAAELKPLEASRVVPMSDGAAAKGTPAVQGTAPVAPRASAAAKLRKATNVETWQGCHQDDYCYQQYIYCNENCQPWDPYLPCEGCTAAYSSCQTGTQVNQWTEESVVSQQDLGPVCGRPSYSQTYREFNQRVHQEFQMWKCSREGYYEDYTTVNTEEHYYFRLCFQLINPYGCSPANDGADIDCHTD